MDARDRQRGAATVELIGIGVVIALLMAGLSSWLPRNVAVDEDPPPVVSRLAAPIAPIEGAPDSNLNHRLPPWPRYAQSSGNLAQVGAEAWAVALEGYELLDQNPAAFGEGFRRCFLEDVRSLYEDPLGEPAQLVASRAGTHRRRPKSDERSDGRPSSLVLLAAVVKEAGGIGPATRRVFEDGLEQIRRGDIEAYGQTLSREAGCLAWDIGVMRGVGAGTKLLTSRARDRAERSSP